MTDKRLIPFKFAQEKPFTVLYHFFPKSLFCSKLIQGICITSSSETFPISHGLFHNILASAVTITGASTTSTHHRPTHARFSPDRQIPIRIPLILDVVWRPLEMPISESSTALDLLFQAASIRTQLRVRKVLAANLKPIQY